LSNEPPPPSDFASILRASLLRETVTKSHCRTCGTPAALMRSRRELPQRPQLPQALSINASVHTAEHLGFWLDGVGPGASASATAASGGKLRRTFLPPMLALDVNGEDVRARGIWDNEERASFPDAAIYALRSMVVQIQADKEAPHLCTIVRVPEEPSEGENTGGSAERKWYLFNDFLVRPLPEHEALGMPGVWKVSRAAGLVSDSALTLGFRFPPCSSSSASTARSST
jgi:PAB-dependent poly(A)-specific ribonuclease subunit 2